MNPLSDAERRALAILAALLLLAAAARWIERPQDILADVPELDVAALAEASRDAKETRAGGSRTDQPASRAPVGPTPLAPAPPKPTMTPKPTSPTVREPIDMNRASAEQLEAISGIGPALAARLIARRDSLGRFRSWADVDSVRGIGPAVLARIQAQAVLR